MISALFVLSDGPYSQVPNIDLWDKARDARKFNGPGPVIAHPPCERWGRYWSGGPSARIRRELGDDDGCFKSALESVRAYGGILEHPEASHAFKKFYLPIPDFNGGWTDPDLFRGMSCCVSQGHYGHAARKMTWLYYVGERQPPELKWGPSENKLKIDLRYHSKEERARAIKTGSCQRLSKRQRLLTPAPFRDLLISIVEKERLAHS